MASERVHLVLAAEERAAFRVAAQREGTTLSEWLRRAARQRLEDAERPAIRTLADLDGFFDECDALDGTDARPEPDWHLLGRQVDDERVGRVGPPT